MSTAFVAGVVVGCFGSGFSLILVFFAGGLGAVAFAMKVLLLEDAMVCVLFALKKWLLGFPMLGAMVSRVVVVGFVLFYSAVALLLSFSV